MTEPRPCNECEKEIKEEDARTFYYGKEIHVDCLPKEKSL